MRGGNLTEQIDIPDMTRVEAKAELARLAEVLGRANSDYYVSDMPEISDAEYDALKRRNAEIENRFPDLKRQDSPSDQVGARPAEGFSKVSHRVRMLSLGNAFDDSDVSAFDSSIRQVSWHVPERFAGLYRRA